MVICKLIALKVIERADTGSCSGVDSSTVVSRVPIEAISFPNSSKLVIGFEMAAIAVAESPKLAHTGPILRPGWICGILCGKSGCGKTSLLLDLIPQLAAGVKMIIIATRVHANPVHLAIKQWCEERKRRCAIADDPLAIESGVDELRDGGYLVPGSKELLIIFDDFSIHGKSPAPYQRLVVSAFTRWRNLGINVITVCQDITMVDPMCRNCTNMRVLFNTGSKSKLDTFIKDIREIVPSAEVLKQLLRFIVEVPFAYVLVREGPFEVSVGRGPRGQTKITPVMSLDAVAVPSYQEVLREMHASSSEELERVAARAQRAMGNTAPELSAVEAERTSK